MHPRFIHLRLEDLESRLVAGSYFGGPTAGGLAGPWPSFLTRESPQAAGHAAAGSSCAAGYSQASSDTHTSLPRTLSRTAADGSTHDTASPNNAPRLTSAPRLAADDLNGLPVLDQGVDLNTGLEPPTGTARGHHGAPASDPAVVNPGAAASLNAAGQAGGGVGSVAPGSPPAAAANTPVSEDPTARRVSENLAAANGLGTSGGGSSGLDRVLADGLSIPHDHPRIWWTHRNLRQAQAYYAEHPFVPASDDVVGHAMLYVLYGDTTAAASAINTLMNFTVPQAELDGVASDTYRWNGWVPIVFDWVHDAMTPGQIQTFTDRYNYYAFTMMNKSWGGPTMPGNNYFWGYFANELNWAIATYYENPMAQTFLDDALTTRWQNSFVPWAQTIGLGGVFSEGTEYSKADLAYPALPLTAAALLGGQQYSQTDFYKQAIFNLIYTTSPAPTYSKESPNQPYYIPFPSGEEEHDGGYPNIADSTTYGDFMQAAADAYGGLPVGQYAYQYLQTVQPPQTDYTYPYNQYTPTYDPQVPAADFSSLPVDYYAPGAQYFYTRDQWGADATSVFLALGQSGESHANLDAGSFEIWRNGWFVTKNTTGYDLQINGGVSENPIAQNTLLFGGQGIARSWRDSDPQVIRLQSAPNFSYAAVDMSGAFHSSYASLTNPYASQAIREFIFIKPLQTMVILDRLESSSDAIPAQNVTKTFLLHFPNQPQPDGSQSWVGVSGDQALRLTNLVPGNASYNVVDESNFNGTHDPDPAFYQYRLEENTSGSAQSYFLNVLQARDAGGANVTSSMSQDANSWTVTLSEPGVGYAKIVLNKGLTSQGGSVGFSTSGIPTNLTPLLGHVQGIQVTDNGPAWGS